jgi:hypothetical protein
LQSQHQFLVNEGARLFNDNSCLHDGNIRLTQDIERLQKQITELHAEKQELIDERSALGDRELWEKLLADSQRLTEKVTKIQELRAADVEKHGAVVQRLRDETAAL